jgi:hypothetical protein
MTPANVIANGNQKHQLLLLPGDLRKRGALARAPMQQGRKN